MGKFNYFKVLCYTRVITKKIKRQVTTWETISEIQITDIGVAFRTYQALLKINKKMTNKRPG